MTTDDWRTLSDWHSRWLGADDETRERLHAQLAADHPALTGIADNLTSATGVLDEFLELPALAVLAADLASGTGTFAAGTQIGPYRVVTLLASGGMGDVYRATDVRLGRDVALKTLASVGEATPQAFERFMQEARVTASLQHPNIVRVFDVGVFGGHPYLVSELLDGETLRAALARGAMPARDVQRIAVDIVRGLVAAHAAGLVHRDLKPENILLEHRGPAKILDFGVAKLARDPAVPNTLTTLSGVVFGTAPYLAPEQVRGEPVDGRSDLFTLGSILFEMLTGRRAFAREHTIDTLHAIAFGEPPDLGADVSEESLAVIVTRLLQKAPEDRFQSATDLLWALERDAPSPSPGARRGAKSQTRSRWSSRAMVPATIAVAVLSGFAAWRLFANATPAPEPLPLARATRFTWSLPEGNSLGSAPVVAPDGQAIAFTAAANGASHLYVRRLDSFDVVQVAASAGARHPFWSPDGSAIGFFAAGKLMRVDVAGGVPVEICDAPDGRGGTWSRNGTIVFAPNLIGTGLSRVRASGGPVEPATRLETAQGDNSHRWPVFLPDDVHFVYFNRSVDDTRRGVYVGRVDDQEGRSDTLLFRSESEALYVPPDGPAPGALLYAVGGELELRAFDATRLELTGDPQRLGLAVGGSTPYEAMLLGASPRLLAAAAAPIPYGVRLMGIDGNGANTRLWPERQPQGWPRISPDGRRLARQRIDAVRGNPDVWVEDLATHTLTRITTGIDSDVLPTWSPDSTRIAYGTGPLTRRHVSIAATDGTGVLRTLECPGAYCEPTDWSRDGRDLLVNVRATFNDTRSADVWAIPLDRPGAARRVLAGAFAEYDARLSPDGQWIAYVSEETGRPEISIRSLAGTPRRLVVSNGGSQPVWRPDGREILYVGLDGRLRRLSVRADAAAGLSLGTAIILDVPPVGSGHWGTQYDVSDTGRLYYFDRTTPAPPRDIAFLLDWRMLLK